MKNIFFRDGILIYYGNPAGYLSEGKVVLDSIFDKEEIIAFLSEKEKLAVEIRSGVYDRLSEGGGMEMTVEASKGRRIRIYQLKQDSPFMMRFISLAEREKRGFEKPQQKEYALVYEGEVDTFSLEDVWEKFGRRVPRDFEGHALSISDVVEFSEEEVSRYFYVEPKGFAEITFRIAGRRKGRTWQEKEQKTISRIPRAMHRLNRQCRRSRLILMYASTPSNQMSP